MKKLFSQQMFIKPLAVDFIEAKWPLLIEGPTGIGKNYLIETIAEEKNKDIIRVNLNVNVSQEDLWGQNVLIKDDNASIIKFKDGPVVRAVQNGSWLLLDEINAALPEVLFSLHALLERNKKNVYIPILQETIKINEEFRIIATMNPSDEYFGTRSLNQAFLNRFMTLELRRPSLIEISDVLKDFYSAKEVEVTVFVLTKLIQEFTQWKVDLPISVRDFEKVLVLLRSKELYVSEYLSIIFKESVKLLPEEALSTFNRNKIETNEKEMGALFKFLQNPQKYIDLISMLENKVAQIA